MPTLAVPLTNAMCNVVDVEYRLPVPVRPVASTDPPAGKMESTTTDGGSPNNGSLASLLTSVEVMYEQAESGQLLSDQVNAPTTRKNWVAFGVEASWQLLSEPAARQQVPTYQIRW